MTPHHFRAIALGLPEAAEGSHLGRADFRAGGKIFATLTPELGIGMVKLTPEQQEMLCAAEPRIFTPVPGGWGRRGATHIRLEAIDEATLTSALGMAFRNVAPKRLKAELDRKPTKVVGGDAPASARAERDRPTLSVRKARRTEAEAMSQLMVRAIRETNARDYEPSIIEALAANFAAPEVERRTARAPRLHREDRRRGGRHGEPLAVGVEGALGLRRPFAARPGDRRRAHGLHREAGAEARP